MSNLCLTNRQRSVFTILIRSFASIEVKHSLNCLDDAPLFYRFYSKLRFLTTKIRSEASNNKDNAVVIVLFAKLCIHFEKISLYKYASIIRFMTVH